MSDKTSTAEILWGSRTTPRRGPKPVLSLDRIVETAIAMADADGLAALSMQRIASELGFTKMSLYRHTPGKAELTALMLDTALGGPPDLTTVDGGWRPRLRAWTLDIHDRMGKHPWTVDAAVGGRVLGPNELGWLEAGLAALDTPALTGSERLDAVALLAGHARSQVQLAPSPARKPEREMNDLMVDVFARHRDRYPHATAAFAQARADNRFDEALEFGLDRILDGLAALIAARSG